MFRAWSRASVKVKFGLVAAWCVVCSVFAANTLVQFLAILAFFMGAGGMGIMFFRWRLHGDRVAGVLCFVAFGAWGLSVVMGIMASESHLSAEPASWIAGAALLIGFVGGLVTLLRMRRVQSGTDKRKSNTR